MHTGINTGDMVKIAVWLPNVFINKISQGRTRSKFPLFLHYPQPSSFLIIP